VGFVQFADLSSRRSSTCFWSSVSASISIPHGTAGVTGTLGDASSDQRLLLIGPLFLAAAGMSCRSRFAVAVFCQEPCLCCRVASRWSTWCRRVS
jgi:hypothetical protein